MNRTVILVTLALLASGVVHAGTLGSRLAALARGHLSLAVPANSRRAVENPLAPRLDASGRVQVYVQPSVPGSALPDVSEIAALGGVRIQVSAPLDLVQAWVPVGELRALAELPGVGRVRIPTYAVVEPPPGGLSAGRHFRPVTIGYVSNSLPTGLPIDQTAVVAMQANSLQSVGADGQGIKVGVISDDDSGNAASQQAGYLPANIFQDSTYPGTTPTPGDPAEGTAMLEEVHAMVPDAQLGFCGPATSADFLTCYQDLVKWGANVIVDDVGYRFEDMFTRGVTANGSFAAAVDQITQANPDVAFFSAAGNDAQDYFQAPYTPTSSSCAVGTTTYPSCMDFGKAVGQSSGDALPVTLTANYTFIPLLEWNDPLNRNATGESSFPDQLQLYLLNSSGSVLATGSFVTTNDGRPGEAFSYTTGSSSETDYLVVACVTCPDPITVKLLGYGDGVVNFGVYTYGSIDAGQKVAPGVEATVATAVDTLSPLSTTLESYSALGPFLYGDYSATGNQADPSITGVDDVETSGAGGFSAGTTLANGGVAFCGTSATGPNVGALVAALMSADPGQAASFYEKALVKTANPSVIGTSPIPSNNPTGYQCSPPGNTQGYNADDAGAGLAQGYAALTSFFTFPVATVTAPPNVSVSSGNTATEAVPINVGITYSATVKSGTNPASSSQCAWVGVQAGSTSGVDQTGASVVYTFPAAGYYVVTANCPDSQGIANPNPATIDVTAQNIPPPTVDISNLNPTGFDLTLTGTEPISVTVTSGNPAILPDSGISVSSGCGTSTLSCTVALSPIETQSGTSLITVNAVDPYDQTGSASAQLSITVSHSSGGGGSMNPLVLLGLVAFGLLYRRRRYRNQAG